MRKEECWTWDQLPNSVKKKKNTSATKRGDQDETYGGRILEADIKKIDYTWKLIEETVQDRKKK